ncbi:MAG TPA: precorrin-6A reductase [Bacillota bacterium]|nr:precorrin-6A reductase [Bacillota bacterium]
MILLLAGAAEGRDLAKKLVSNGFGVVACAATSYGEELLKDSGAETLGRRLSSEDIENLIREKNIGALVDATHPYAQEVSRAAVQACRRTGTAYIRYQRPASQIKSHPLVYKAKSYLEAAEKAAEMGEVIFLATGSKTLKVFLDAARKRKRKVVARILPDQESLRYCFELGLKPSDVVAVQGPFSTGLNKEILRHYRASVLVTKDGGTAGGFAEKIAAAVELGIPVVVVERPEPPPGAVERFDELLEILKGK